jgi:Na+/H+-dicarboxylate symporter
VLGVDRFMSGARAITNLIGNGAATLVIARSENAFFDPTTTTPDGEYSVAGTERT